MRRLEGKVAFIAGTSSGQGRAAARLFAAEGAFVVGCYRTDMAGGRETEEMVKAAGGRMLTTQTDLADRAQALAWIAAGVEAGGGIDILYNNAAGVRFQPFVEMSPETWDHALRNELDIVFHVTQAAWPHLIARGGGAVINTASTAGLRGRSRLGAAGHATGKAGLMGLTRQLAAEGAPHQIRVNTISPGAIASGKHVATAEQIALVVANIPLGREGRPEEIAYCALWLASDEGAWVTAQNFVIDGGSSEIK
ncbi:SDR family NAD(P)-dependent oxidoreductase [Phenylobacterium sp.]|uniref:SDR family NAD(P)-dependent oxidoreductase n=1 Tax=Phenylobacterium sp. TaxID=1871053 RepID=UPI002F42E32A